MTRDEPVLLAEDDENDVFLVRRAFERSGVRGRLEVVSTGQDAIDYVAGAGPFADRSRHPFPALLLLDLKLPRRTGLEVLEWLRREGARARRDARPHVASEPLPAVVLSSSSQERDIFRAYELGANAYLVKTGRQAELTDMLRGVGRFWLRD